MKWSNQQKKEEREGKKSVNLEFCSQLVTQEWQKNKNISDIQRLMEFNNHTTSSRELIKRCISARKASPNGNMGY